MENIFTNDIKLSLDTSSLTASKLTETEFKENLIEPLQEILNKTFYDNNEKRRIKNTPSSISFACPFCHDSAKDDHKKRGHLILKGKYAGRFKCHNCGMTMPIQKFFSTFNKDLGLSEISYINKELPTDSSYYAQAANDLTSNIINKEEAYKWAIDREFFKNALGLKEIGRATAYNAWNYLVNRCQYKNYERYLYSDKYNQIIILNLVNDRILGAQIRNIDYKGYGPKYLTLTIEKMRETMLGDKTPIPESVSKLSCVFNIFNVDFTNTWSKPVLITEGPFDAFLLPNCIALSGASKGFNMNFPFWYIYDNDATGVEHSLEVLKQGYKTFMWKKFKADYSIPDINPYISNGNKRKWDVTDIMKYLRDNKIEKKLWWSPYFTNSILDGLNI